MACGQHERFKLLNEVSQARERLRALKLLQATPEMIALAEAEFAKASAALAAIMDCSD